MRIICEVCQTEGYLQQLGNYYRVRHYEGKGENGKGKFYYHQQTKDWIDRQLENTKDSTVNSFSVQTGQSVQVTVQESIDPDNLKIASIHECMPERSSSSWLGHKPSKLAIPGSIPGDRTIINLLSVDSKLFN
jgi:hypothetical protein